LVEHRSRGFRHGPSRAGHGKIRGTIVREFAVAGVALGALVVASPALATDRAPVQAAQSKASASRSTVYDAAFFAQYAPRTAFDIVQRIPGFTLDLGNSSAASGVDVRGFAGTAGNVVINGARPSSKSETLDTLLARIPASRVVRVEVGPGDIYGADYSGKTQVANLILREGGGTAGNISVSAVRHWMGTIIPNASGSLSVSHGPSTFNIAADTRRTDYFEEGFDRVTAIPGGQQLEFRQKFNSIHQHDPYVSGSWAMEKSNDDSIHLNARFQPSTFFLHQDNHVIPADAPARDDTLVEDYRNNGFELGGDVTRPLAGGAIKLVALANRQHKTTLDETDTGNLGHTEVVGGFQQLTKSQRNETLGRLTWSSPKLLGFQFEAGGEAAVNTLDFHLDFFDVEQGGAKTKIDLPIQDATVKENRGEIWVNAARPLTNKLRIDAGLNFEFSHLTVAGDASAERKLKFLKPSITLDWQAPRGWHSQLSLRRTVAQLDFFDFVSSADLSIGNRVNGGNANLQPQRTWEARALLEHAIFGKGQLRLELGYDLVSLLQDHILIFDDQGNAFDAPGNLGAGRRQYADLTFDAPLDRIWSGLHVRLHGNIQRTRVTDPISGEPRDWSGFFPRWLWDVDIRRDSGKFAYGVNASDQRRTTFFRTDEFDINYNARPFANAFVEYRPTASQTLTLDLTDISNSGGARDLVIFFPNRTAGEPSEIEHRFRNSHVRIGITFKQSFGGASGKADAAAP
jgi:outer membrane beta-barrel protein/TonB-dependent receptor-like protein